MTKSTVFKSNRCQAVRLPKAVAFPEDVHEVEIVRVGNSSVVTPVSKTWTDWLEHGKCPSADFMRERVQPPPQKRGDF